MPYKDPVKWAAYQREYYRKNAERIMRLRRERYKRGEWARNKDAVKAYQLKSKYGLSVEKYKELLAIQGGRCANRGCRRVLEGRNIAIDHCHKAGHIRGILCQGCNTAIGHLGNSLKAIEGLAEYISRETIFNGF